MDTATDGKAAEGSARTGWLSGSLVGVLIGALGTLLGTYITSSNEARNRARDADVRMVEIGVGVLRAKPDETGAKAAREWAIELVEKRSGVRFSEEAKAQLLERRLDYGSAELYPNYGGTGDYGGSYDFGGRSPAPSQPPLGKGKQPPVTSEPGR